MNTMDILGIGIDLVRISRIRKADQRWGGRFRQRIFTPGEIAYSDGHRFPYPHLAGRFAAKEALFKAIRGRWTEGIRWTDIEVSHGPDGEAVILLHNGVQELFRQRGGTHIFASISHDHDYAVAEVMVAGQRT